MTTERKSEKRWHNYWPLMVALIIALFNVDGVIIPSFQLRWLSILGFKILDLSHIIPELSLWQIFVCVVAISVPGNIFWYWFWGWLGSFVFQLVKKQKTVQEGIELGREIESVIEPVLKKQGFIDKATKFITEKFKWATDENNKYLRRLKRGGCVMLFLMSASPEPGGRVVATIFSRSFDSKKGLISLLLGDTFKNFYMVFGFWNMALKLPNHYFLIAIVLIALYFLGRFGFGVLKKKKIVVASFFAANSGRNN